MGKSPALLKLKKKRHTHKTQPPEPCLSSWIYKAAGRSSAARRKQVTKLRDAAISFETKKCLNWTEGKKFANICISSAGKGRRNKSWKTDDSAASRSAARSSSAHPCEAQSRMLKPCPVAQQQAIFGSRFPANYSRLPSLTLATWEMPNLPAQTSGECTWNRRSEGFLLLVPMPSGMVVGVKALRCWGLISWLTEGNLFMLFILLSGGELEP